jgi:hypothetical protein
VNPNERMLPAISATCAALCVLALRAEGTNRSSGQNSSRSRSGGPSPTGSRLDCDVVLISIVHRIQADPPTPEFRDNFRARSEASRLPARRCCRKIIRRRCPEEDDRDQRKWAQLVCSFPKGRPKTASSKKNLSLRVGPVLSHGLRRRLSAPRPTIRGRRPGPETTEPSWWIKTFMMVAPSITLSSARSLQHADHMLVVKVRSEGHGRTVPAFCRKDASHALNDHAGGARPVASDLQCARGRHCSCVYLRRAHIADGHRHA